MKTTFPFVLLFVIFILLISEKCVRSRKFQYWDKFFENTILWHFRTTVSWNGDEVSSKRRTQVTTYCNNYHFHYSCDAKKNSLFREFRLMTRPCKKIVFEVSKQCGASPQHEIPKLQKCEDEFFDLAPNSILRLP